MSREMVLDPTSPRPSGEETDKHLLDAIQSGDAVERTQAIAELYERYQLILWKFICSRANTEQDTEDLFGEVWSVFLSKIEDFEWRDDTIAADPLRSYVMSIADRTVKIYHRTIATQNTVESVDEEHEVELLALQRWLDSRLEGSNADRSSLKKRADRLLMETLPCLRSKVQQRVFKLAYFGRLSNQEIATTLGLEPGTVRVYKSRAVKALRKLLSDVEL